MTLAFQKVNKSYGKNHALRDFTLTMTPGIYALLGPNGSGKSTLMNILSDNLAADSGCITFAGTDGEPEDIRAMGVCFRKRLGYMPQYPGMYPNYTVFGFMNYMAVLKNVGDHLRGGARKSYIHEKISAILDRVELSDVANHKIASLSGGMKQRLALAQAVLGNPDVLILDEPTAGLDPKQRIAIRNFISEIALNKIVLIATHVVSDVEFIAWEAIMLKKGVISDSGSPYELTQRIEGRVWQTVVKPDEVQPMQAKFRVVNIQNGEQGVILRILSDTKPTDDSVTLVPSLEDYYLYVFGDIL